ncbi:MAG: hypothetical protein BMS9Abin18_0652 [Zetaproteobacteria bacterium]|nr:MAG: hypothetical protein BMS9Abin18_0652 [Zetaproteobacteria bacterium]
MNKHIKWTTMLVMGLALIGASMNPAMAGGGARNVNFAAFQKVDAGFEYDAIVLGKFSDFIKAMDGTQVLLLSHTADAVDGDVINVQQDVLREDKGVLSDFGINCQMSFRDESTSDNTSYAIGGMCKIIEVGHGKNLKLTVIIPMISVPDTAQGIDAWVLLDEDEKTGIAFYGNVSTSR